MSTINPHDTAAELYAAVVDIENEAERLTNDTHLTDDGRADRWQTYINNQRPTIDNLVTQLETAANGMANAATDAAEQVTPTNTGEPNTADELAAARILARDNFDHNAVADLVTQYQGTTLLTLVLNELKARNLVTDDIINNALKTAGASLKEWNDGPGTNAEKARVIIQRMIDNVPKVYVLETAAAHDVSRYWVDLTAAGLPQDFTITA